MGEVASTHAGHVVITDDNPRSESSADIASEIIRGVVAGSYVEVETDRRSAIWNTLSNAGCGDVVLIAGKGHEEYQEVAGKRLAFSDHEVVDDYVSEHVSGGQ